jgi:hypothetical protein
MNTISYELAKRLKDAGFPQKGRGTFWSQSAQFDGREEVYFPTLSELIEVCGQDFFSLHISRTALRFKDVWFAHRSYEDPGSEGYTPEEAVARLYLALHEKETPQLA